MAEHSLPILVVEDIGKPRGIDIKERKMTLPLIYTLNTCSKEKKKWLINSIKNHNEDKERVNEVIQFINTNGGIEYTQMKMYEYKQKAFDIINTIPDSVAKTGFVDLVNYITERNF